MRLQSHYGNDSRCGSSRIPCIIFPTLYTYDNLCSGAFPLVGRVLPCKINRNGSWFCRPASNSLTRRPGNQKQGIFKLITSAPISVFATTWLNLGLTYVLGSAAGHANNIYPCSSQPRECSSCRKLPSPTQGVKRASREISYFPPSRDRDSSSIDHDDISTTVIILRVLSSMAYLAWVSLFLISLSRLVLSDSAQDHWIAPDGSQDDFSLTFYNGDTLDIQWIGWDSTWTDPYLNGVTVANLYLTSYYGYNYSDFLSMYCLIL